MDNKIKFDLFRNKGSYLKEKNFKIAVFLDKTRYVSNDENGISVKNMIDSLIKINTFGFHLEEKNLHEYVEDFNKKYSEDEAEEVINNDNNRIIVNEADDNSSIEEIHQEHETSGFYDEDEIDNELENEINLPNND